MSDTKWLDSIYRNMECGSDENRKTTKVCFICREETDARYTKQEYDIMKKFLRAIVCYYGQNSVNISEKNENLKKYMKKITKFDLICLIDKMFIEPSYPIARNNKQIISDERKEKFNNIERDTRELMIKCDEKFDVRYFDDEYTAVKAYIRAIVCKNLTVKGKSKSINLKKFDFLRLFDMVFNSPYPWTARRNKKKATAKAYNIKVENMAKNNSVSRIDESWLNYIKQVTEPFIEEACKVEEDNRYFEDENLALQKFIRHIVCKNKPEKVKFITNYDILRFFDKFLNKVYSNYDRSKKELGPRESGFSISLKDAKSAIGKVGKTALEMTKDGARVVSGKKMFERRFKDMDNDDFKFTDDDGPVYKKKLSFGRTKKKTCQDLANQSNKWEICDDDKTDVYLKCRETCAYTRERKEETGDSEKRVKGSRVIAADHNKWRARRRAQIDAENNKTRRIKRISTNRMVNRPAKRKTTFKKGRKQILRDKSPGFSFTKKSRKKALQRKLYGNPKEMEAYNRLSGVEKKKILRMNKKQRKKFLKMKMKNREKNF